MCDLKGGGYLCLVKGCWGGLSRGGARVLGSQGKGDPELNQP